MEGGIKGRAFISFSLGSQAMKSDEAIYIHECIKFVKFGWKMLFRPKVLTFIQN